MFENNNVYATADYVGFIKKIMKLMQKGYNEIQALEVELRILEQTSAPPSRPRKCIQCIFFTFFCLYFFNRFYLHFRKISYSPSRSRFYPNVENPKSKQ